MKRILEHFLLCAVALFLTSALAYAQATAQLSGRVTDEEDNRRRSSPHVTRPLARPALIA